MSHSDDEQFEAEVRRIAGLLWPEDSLRFIGNNEYDGVFSGEDVTVIVEATTSGRKQKVEDDVRDIDKAVVKLAAAYSDRVFKGFVVTRQDPTADQLEAAKSARHCKIQVLSYDRFRQRLIDAPQYIDLRKAYRFGSASSTESYIPLNLLERTTSASLRTSQGVVEGLQAGKRYALLGDFGTGKSMTLRDVWMKSVRAYQLGKTNRFPILLNLRDHQGQRNPAEALERHAVNIGFASKHQLVRSWRAGEAILLLDGFDEFVSQAWTGRTTKLKAARYESVTLLRSMLSDTPPGVGILLAGRQHYFDTEDELRTALGISREYIILDVQEFSEEQVRKYLRERGIIGTHPDWLPARPLFLNYLLSNDVTKKALVDAATQQPTSGWIHIVDSMCEREAQIEVGLDFTIIRRILQRLASYARNTFSGLGPIPPAVVREIFRQVCGQEPDDQSSLLLQRLPGLGVVSDEPDARQFIDEELTDVLRAGDVDSYIANPYVDPPPGGTNWNYGLRKVGLQYLADVTAIVETGRLSAALERASQDAYYMLATDLLQVLISSEKNYTGNNCEIVGSLIDELDFDSCSVDLSRICLRECIIGTLRVSPEGGSNLPILMECAIEFLEGRVSDQDLPVNMQNCMIERYSDALTTTDNILIAGLNVPVAVCLTILRKLFLQKGAARRENGLFRGLNTKSQRYVEDVLEALLHEGFATNTRIGENTIWRPVRSRTGRVRQMLIAPSLNTDPLLVRVRAMADT